MKSFLLAAFAVLCAASAQAKTYTIDGSHSGVTFKIRHFAAKVPGSFGNISGTFDYDPKNPKAWKAEAEILAESINTSNEKRDGHLRSADFFDVANCSKITFKSTKVSNVKGNTAKLTGDLTLHCVTKPVTLDIEIADEVAGKLGVSAKGKLNRKDFGIVWNKTLDKGALMLGEEVAFEIELETAP